MHNLLTATYRRCPGNQKYPAAWKFLGANQWHCSHTCLHRPSEQRNHHRLHVKIQNIRLNRKTLSSILTLPPMFVASIGSDLYQPCWGCVWFRCGWVCGQWWQVRWSDLGPVYKNKYKNIFPCIRIPIIKIIGPSYLLMGSRHTYRTTHLYWDIAYAILIEE